VKKKKYLCGRCKKIIINKPFYRYPHVWATPRRSQSCSEAIYAKIIILCNKCLPVFDKFDAEMRGKHLYTDNDSLIKFYEQYRGNHGKKTT